MLLFSAVDCHIVLHSFLYFLRVSLSFLFISFFSGCYHFFFYFFWPYSFLWFPFHLPISLSTRPLFSSLLPYPLAIRLLPPSYQSKTLNWVTYWSVFLYIPVVSPTFNISINNTPNSYEIRLVFHSTSNLFCLRPYRLWFVISSTTQTHDTRAVHIVLILEVWFGPTNLINSLLLHKYGKRSYPFHFFFSLFFVEFHTTHPSYDFWVSFSIRAGFLFSHSIAHFISHGIILSSLYPVHSVNGEHHLNQNVAAWAALLPKRWIAPLTAIVLCIWRIYWWTIFFSSHVFGYYSACRL